MIFPTLALWSNRDPGDALGRIDRALDDRNHRLSVGLSVSSKFDRVHGALVVTQGNGKYLRIRHVVEANQSIPKSLRDSCIEVAKGQQRNSGQIALLASDLAEVQAADVEKLKCAAGKYVDRVLAVAVCDPGVWDQDFDGKTTYTPFCDSMRLAELCGVTVIDAFPARDLEVDGNGEYLESLPYWILFSDRNPKVASQSRNLVVIDDDCMTYRLPASDGLDSEIPNIDVTKTLGVGFLNRLVQHSFPGAGKLSEMDRIYADGLQIPELHQEWSQFLLECKSTNRELNSGGRADGTEVSNYLLESATHYLATNPQSFSNIVRTAICLIVEECVSQFAPQRNGGEQGFLLAAPAQFEAGLINQFTQVLSGASVTTTRQAGIDQDDLAPVVASILGLFNIDQMPANVPWLTGANCQRILGRLTPGRPSSWRQLVRVMADFQPAPMKLKDAV